MRLEVSPSALRDLAKIRDPQMRARVEASLARLCDEPRPRGAKMLQGKAGRYLRIRVGDYRIVYEAADQVIVVLRVGNRRDVYR